MKAIFDLVQQTEDWFKIKYGKVGGTASKVKDETLIYQLLAEHTEPFEMDYDSYISDEMQRGNDLEPLARKALNDYLGIELLPCGIWLSESNDLLCCSPDGCTSDLTVACEIKCPSAKVHLKSVVENEVPLDHTEQILHYFTVNEKLQTLHFLSYRPESRKPMFVKTINLDTQINVGTKAKPKMQAVSFAASESRKRFENLKQDLKSKLEIVNSI
jgi:hypothetical protein